MLGLERRKEQRACERNVTSYMSESSGTTYIFDILNTLMLGLERGKNKERANEAYPLYVNENIEASSVFVIINTLLLGLERGKNKERANEAYSLYVSEGSRSYFPFPTPAIHSISIKAPLGNPPTATQARAGLVSAKNCS